MRDSAYQKGNDFMAISSLYLVTSGDTPVKIFWYGRLVYYGKMEYVPEALLDETIKSLSIRGEHMEVFING